MATPFTIGKRFIVDALNEMIKSIKDVIGGINRVSGALGGLLGEGWGQPPPDRADRVDRRGHDRARRRPGGADAGAARAGVGNAVPAEASIPAGVVPATSYQLPSLPAAALGGRAAASAPVVVEHHYHTEVSGIGLDRGAVKQAVRELWPEMQREASRGW